MGSPIPQEIRAQPASLLRRLELRLDRPFAILGIVWLVLLAIELTIGPGAVPHRCRCLYLGRVRRRFCRQVLSRTAKAHLPSAQLA